jgi:hypothetical protein
MAKNKDNAQKQQDEMSKAFQKSTGMPVVNQPQPTPGETTFAKDEKK